MLCTHRSPRFDYRPFLFDAYKPGSRPESIAGTAEINKLKSLLSSSLNTLDEHYNKGIFTGYDTFTTRYGAVISSIDEALDFLLYHEGLHSGYIMALKRVVQ